jgi:hypothetical protein
MVSSNEKQKIGEPENAPVFRPFRVNLAKEGRLRHHSVADRHEIDDAAFSALATPTRDRRCGLRQRDSKQDAITAVTRPTAAIGNFALIGPSAQPQLLTLGQNNP